ncbi:MAG: efflux RND transporter periplasmic adaptor subunit [Candidatus Omnitrophica bacterium]|nr:efflux RND transporter periplasmic adaptor subunit [Candidatus Omnitrophota bacterium]
MKRWLKTLLKNKLFYLVLVLIILFIVGIRIQIQKQKTGGLVLYKVQRQNLTISIIEGGNLVALESQKIVNEVPGTRNILEVVDEGTQITEEDVKNGRVLIKLDSKDLLDKLEQLKITVENSLAAYTQEQQQMEILKKENESNINQAELNVRFAEIDLKKYLGDALIQQIIDKNEKIDTPSLIKSDNLGGDALNRKRALENNIDLAREEVARAKDTVEWSEKLAEKGYVTKSELEADKLALKQKEVKQEQAELEYNLFLKYEFPKEVEKLLSNYREVKLQLERVKATAKAKMIQAEANLRSKKASYMLNKNNMEDVEQQIEKCTIRATRTGFVTYATSDRPWATSSPIQPGTSVRQYQELLNLPDFNSMGVEIKIHEASIKNIKIGMPAQIRIDAFPDVILTGKVVKISVMPDTTLKFLNPDVNVYVTRIALDKSMDFLKPGMSSKAEVFIKELKDVLTIPVNAVFFKSGKPYCTVFKKGNITDREIELGESSEIMVEVKSGLSEGEQVVIKPGAGISSAVKKAEMEEKGIFKQETPESRQNIQPQQINPSTLENPAPSEVQSFGTPVPEGGISTGTMKERNSQRRRPSEQMER